MPRKDNNTLGGWLIVNATDAERIIKDMFEFEIFATNISMVLVKLYSTEHVNFLRKKWIWGQEFTSWCQLVDSLVELSIKPLEGFWSEFSICNRIVVLFIFSFYYYNIWLRGLFNQIWIQKHNWWINWIS